MPQSHNQTIKTGILIVAVIGLLSAAVAGYEQLDSQTTTTSQQAGPQQTQQQQRTRAGQTSQYQDGKYTQTGTYTSPAGPEEIDITITLENDVITAAKVVALATNPASKRYQEQFVSGFEEQVIGKPIDEVELDVVAGSSLTPKGFNEALQNIMREQAQ